MATTFNQLPMGLFINTLREVFTNEAKKGKNFIPIAYKTEATDKWYTKRQSLTGLGAVSTWDGESSIEADTIQPRFESTLTQVIYRKVIAYTWKLKTYDNYNTMREMVNSLAYRMYNAQQTLAMGFFNDQLAASGTVWNASENKYFFATDHPLAGSTDTVSNKATAALSVSALQSAIYALETQKDEQGEIMNLRAKRLWVHPYNHINALEILNKGIGLRSDTAENTRNAFDEWGLELVVCPFIKTETAWYLQADQYRTHCEVSVDMETEQWKEEASKTTYQDAVFAMAFGASDWRGWYGSTGAG